MFLIRMLFRDGTVFSLTVLLLLAPSLIFEYSAKAQEENEGADEQQDIPDVNAAIGSESANIRDSNLRVKSVVEGLELPTTMAFIGPDDFLVLEKEKGTVQRVTNGEMLPEPLLDVNVATSQERCMCGVAISN